MISMKYRVVNLHLSDFRTSIMHLTLLLLMSCCGGDSQAAAPSKQTVAMLGDDVVLPCHLVSAGNAADLTVEWARPDLDPRFVLFRRGGIELQHEKHPTYKGRTSLSEDKLKCGDLSLKLSGAKLSDSGTYRCLVPTTDTDSTIQLTVGSVSSPFIHMSSVGNRVLLDCKSKAWYPEPEVLWLDEESKPLSAGSTKSVKGPDGLYTVSSKLTVDHTHGNSFTCRVQQRNINQTREAQVHVPDELLMTQSKSAVRISIIVVICVLSIAAVVLLLWKWGPNKRDKIHDGEVMRMSFGNVLELQPLMGGGGDRLQSVTVHEKIKYLDSTKAKLEEELGKTEGELRHVEEVITKLMDQKKDLKSQREKIILLQQTDMVKIAENEKKLKTPPKTGKEHKKKKREDASKDLAKRKKTHDDMLKETEKLLEKTDDMITTMTERKGKLEKDKEQISKYLTETERQRGEAESKSEELKKHQAENEPQSEEQKKPQAENEPQPEEPDEEDKQFHHPRTMTD
ncbi:butyrophilin subfamily 1 member A1-like [Xyrichtys novacula]|uniref:Butyrophilin subfamily 1 member A1-like n=1 Tax=Xyrichtys novacula TaxID=13765 RepID=A0AAV1EHV0_XYRNO|nr:butyrophilin subfamily 1 member A1-like [Xyrichtys novacula]